MLMGGTISGYKVIFSVDGSSRDGGDHIDVLLIGMDEDHHIASLFPHSRTTTGMGRNVLAAAHPKLPAKWISVAPRVIGEVRPDSLRELPVWRASRKTWHLDWDEKQKFPKDFVCE